MSYFFLIDFLRDKSASLQIESKKKYIDRNMDKDTDKVADTDDVLERKKFRDR